MIFAATQEMHESFDNFVQWTEDSLQIIIGKSQFNLFHPRIIIHDMGQVKQFPYTILDHYSELQ
jgi:hypothetical protein